LRVSFDEEKMIFLISFLSKKEPLPIVKPCEDSVLTLLAFYIIHPDHRISSAKLILYAISCFKNEQIFILPTVLYSFLTLFVDFFKRKKNFLDIFIHFQKIESKMKNFHNYLFLFV
jgi:hypothetical protein